MAEKPEAGPTQGAVESVTPTGSRSGGLSQVLPRCPVCKTVQPPYGFHFNSGDLGILGFVTYFTIYCAAKVPSLSDLSAGVDGEPCGAILGVNIMQYQPPTSGAELAALQEALRTGRQRH